MVCTNVNSLSCLPSSLCSLFGPLGGCEPTATNIIGDEYHQRRQAPDFELSIWYTICVLPRKTVMEPTAKNVSDCAEFTSHHGVLLVADQKYIMRILKMNGSTMVFLSSAEPECLDEVALAMKMPQDNQVVGTSILGPQIITDSQRMATKLCKRFGRHFIVSYNVNVDRMIAPLLEKQLSEYVRAHEDHFV